MNPLWERTGFERLLPMGALGHLVLGPTLAALRWSWFPLVRWGSGRMQWDPVRTRRSSTTGAPDARP
eukprot:2396283-Prymnesium_polylepis.1